MAENLIPVVSPTGQQGTIPADNWEAARAKGYTLLDQNTVVPVTNPDGVEGTVPAVNLDRAISKGYLPGEQGRRLQDAAFARKQFLDAGVPVHIEPENLYAGTTKERLPKENEFAIGMVSGGDKIYKMKDASGKDVDVPADDLYKSILEKNYQFRDPLAQSLLDANIRKLRESGEFGPLTALGTGIGKSIPGAESLTAQHLANQDDFNKVADSMARLYLMATEHKALGTAGQLIGTTAQIVGTGGAGLFGEGKIGTALGGAIEEGLAPEGAGLARQLLAKGVSQGATGITYTAPQAIAQMVIDKDPKAAAETLALGFGFGAGLGTGTVLISKGIPALTEAIRPSVVDSALRELPGATDEMLAKLGTPEQKEQLVKDLADNLGAVPSKEKIETALQHMAEGSTLAPTLEKLDPYLKEATTSDGLQMKIAAEGQVAKSIDPEGWFGNAGKKVEEVSSKLKALTDEKGNISLPNLQKFAEDIGKEINWKEAADKATKGEAVNGFLKRVQEETMSTLGRQGDNAAAQAPANVAADWLNHKFVPEISKQMHLTFVGDAIKGATKENSTSNRIVDIIKRILKHQTGHLIGGAIGATVGHPFIGGMVGKEIVEALSEGLGHYATNPENPSKLTGFLSRRVYSPAIASYVALDSVHAMSQQVDKIPDYLKALTVKGGTTFATKDNPIKQILGPEANGLSKDQQFARFSQRINFMAANQEVRDQHLARIVAPFALEHPELAIMLKKEMDNKIQYINQIMPKNPNPPQPFVKDDKWKPTPAQLQEFHAQLKVAQNPFALLDGLKDGTITSKQVATAGILNPQILSIIRDKIATIAYSGKVDLTYQQRLSASLLMGQNMDASLRQLPQLQSVYGPPPGASAAPPGPTSSGRKGGGGSKISAAHTPTSKETMAQRIANK